MDNELKWDSADTASVKKWLRAIIIIGVLFILATSVAVFISAGERGVLMDFGKVRVDTILTPGLKWVIPFYNTVAKMDVQTQID